MIRRHLLSEKNVLFLVRKKEERERDRERNNRERERERGRTLYLGV